MTKQFEEGDIVICVRKPEGELDDSGWRPMIGKPYHVEEWFEGSEAGAVVDLVEDPFQSEEAAWDVNAFVKAEDVFAAMVGARSIANDLYLAVSGSVDLMSPADKATVERVRKALLALNETIALG